MRRRYRYALRSHRRRRELRRQRREHVALLLQIVGAAEREVARALKLGTQKGDLKGKTW